MPETELSLPDGEPVLKESADNHFLRPRQGLLGRLCRSYLTPTRLVLREARGDAAEAAETGAGAILHEVPLASIEALRPGPDSAEPALELDARFDGGLDTVLLCFRDDGWPLGAPRRLAERDAWLAAIAGQIRPSGVPLEGSRPLASPAAANALASGPEKPREDKNGWVIGGKYELRRRIGIGGMGVVFEGMDRSLDRPVAVKKMRPEIKLVNRDKSLFLKEAKISASLHHPFVVDIYAVLEEESEIYLVFEFVDGETLQERLERKGRIAPDKARPILRCVCEALAYAHSRKVAHRDLKPSNIMLARQGYAKVMDFGIARQIKDTASRLTTADVSGTLPYMAPEQELGRFDARSDIFSLGATVYEMLSGAPPFAGPNFYLSKERMEFQPLLEAAPEVPPVLAAAVEYCLAFDPGARLQSIEEFAAAAGV